MVEKPALAPPARLRPALSLAVSGGLGLFVALIAHEFYSFGPSGHGLINADRTICPDIACPTTGIIVVAHIAKAIGAAFLFGIIGAIWTSGRMRISVSAIAFAVQFLWSLVGMASGYRAQFGTTWRWWEPFTELLWHPVATAFLLLAGLAICISLDRWLNRSTS